MITSACEWCGKEKQYKYPSKVRRFCSHQCSNEWKWTKRKRAEMVSFECQQCGEAFSIPESQQRSRENKGEAIQFCSQTCSGLAHQKAFDQACVNCGYVFQTTRNKSCSRQCAIQYKKKTQSMKRNGYWMENGYKVLYTSDGKGIKEHIKVMTDHLGRSLNHDEVVHHINGDRLDNRMENLQLMTRGEHSRLHRLEEIQSGKQLFGRA